MMTYFEIYFDPADLVVDRDGELTNPEALHIIGFDEDGNPFGRVDSKGKEIAEPEPMEDILQMYHLGYGDDDLDGARSRFYRWLQNNLEWQETSPATYYEPAEYACVGITGYCDPEPNEYWHPVRHYYWRKR